MKCLFSNRILYEDHLLSGGILVNGEYIEDIIPAPSIEAVLEKIGTKDSIELINMKDKYLLPGLIDIHVHGGNGHDIMEATYEAFNALSKYKAQNGVTSFVATTVTAPFDRVKEVLRSGKRWIEKGVEGSKILGFFLEGPYISKEKKGAHPEQCIRKIDLDEIKTLNDLSEGTLLRFAIAPELENADDAIHYLKNENINISMGHSNASYETGMKAIDKGATIGIHMYNAMSSLRHREPGMVGALLNHPNIYTEIICDNIHVHDAAIQLLYRLKGIDQLIAITDCMAGGGLEDGVYQLGEKDVQVKEGAATLENGTIAGSTLKLNEGIYNLMRITGEPLTHIIRTATVNVAHALKLSQIGEIKKHYKADIIAADEDMNIYMTMVNGRVVYKLSKQ